MQPELDKNLLSLFEAAKRSLPEEPFLGHLLRLVEKQRSRRTFMRLACCLAGLVGCAVLSPFLIEASIVLSNGLNNFFGAVGSVVNTPSVALAVTVCALLLIFLNRRQISRFV